MSPVCRLTIEYDIIELTTVVYFQRSFFVAGFCSVGIACCVTHFSVWKKWQQGKEVIGKEYNLLTGHSSPLIVQLMPRIMTDEVSRICGIKNLLRIAAHKTIGTRVRRNR